MKILYVTARFPYPPLKGDQVVPWHRLRLLSKLHDITLLTFYESEDQLTHLPRLQEYCEAVHLVKLKVSTSMLSVALRAAVSSDPMQVSYYKSLKFRQKLNELLLAKDFDVVHAFMLRIAPYVSDISLPKILELNDSMQLNLQRRAERSGRLMKRLIREELGRITRMENALHHEFERLIVTSEKDREFIAGDNICVLPLGVDVDAFHPRPSTAKRTSIVFSGNMAYPPNVDAACWFVERCLPLVRAEIPEASMTIVGANPCKLVRDLGKKTGVEVRGFVESMSDALNESRVAVAPMRSGSGMQFKVLEAMACGIPVVATSLGVGDIKASPGVEIEVADNAEAFALQVKKLLRQPGLAHDIGHRGREFVLRHHNWSVAASHIESMYEQLCSRPPAFRAEHASQMDAYSGNHSVTPVLKY
jgi:sugar transferase (PEP-CTERM/EpsH1 system associated)